MDRADAIVAGDLGQHLDHGVAHAVFDRAGPREQAGARHRREGHGDLELGIVAAAGALEGLRPAMVEDVFALAVAFHIERGGALQGAVVAFGQQILRLPAGPPADRLGILQRLQEAVAEERVAGRARRQRAGVPLLGRRPRKAIRRPAGRWSESHPAWTEHSSNRARNCARNRAADSTRQVCAYGRARRPSGQSSLGPWTGRPLAHFQSQQVGCHGGHRRFDCQMIQDTQFEEPRADREQRFVLVWLVVAAREAHEYRPRPPGHRHGLVGRTPAADRAGVRRLDVDQEGLAGRFGIEDEGRKSSRRRREVAQPRDRSSAIGIRVGDGSTNCAGPLGETIWAFSSLPARCTLPCVWRSVPF